MKGTMKRIVSILLALALVITSLNYTPKTVSAADYSSLTFTEVSGMDATYAYAVTDNSLVGYSRLNFYGVYYMQIVGSGDSKMSSATITLNGETATGAFAFDRAEAITGFNISTLENNAYHEIVLTGDAGSITIVLKKGDPDGTAETTTEAEMSDSIYKDLTYTDIANNTNTEFDQKLAKSKIAVASGSVVLNVKQYEGSRFSSLYIACGGVSGSNFSATLNGQLVSTATGVNIANAANYLTYEYNVLEIKDDLGDSTVVIYCPGNVGNGTYSAETEETTEEVTTDAPTEEPEETTEPIEVTVDWNSIDWAINGTADAVNTNMYKFYAIDGVGSLVNIQKPAFAKENSLYVTFPSTIAECSLSSYDIQSGGIALGLSSFVAKETFFTVTLNNGTVYKCAVYYENGKDESIGDVSVPEGTESAIEDVFVYNYVEANGGFQVQFEDPNVDTYTAEAGYTTTYNLVIGSHIIPVVAGDVEDASTNVDLSTLGLTEGYEYEAQMYAEYTNGETTLYSVISDASKFVYKTTKTAAVDRGIAQVHFTSTGGKTAAYEGFYNGNENNKPKIKSALTVIDADGNVNAVNFGTANVRGNSTANAAKKPYNFKFDNKQNVLGMGKAKKWSLLANIFDKTLMRNQIAMDFLRSLEASQGMFDDSASKVFTSECQPVDLYIDGKYAGTYTLIESVEIGSTRVNIDKDHVVEDTDEVAEGATPDVVEIGGTTYQTYDVLLELANDNRPDEDIYFFATNLARFGINEPERTNKDAYENQPADDNRPVFVSYADAFVTGFEAALSANDYDTFSQFIDVDSFVDFYITAEYFMTKDIGFSSTRFYIRDGKMYAGPLWDLDLSSGNNGANPSAQNFYAQGSFNWMQLLMANETFAEKVKARYKELQPQIKALYSTGGKVDQAYEIVKVSADANYTQAYNTKLDPSNPSEIGWGYTYIYGNGGFFDQAERNLTIDQAYQTYGVYGVVDAYDNYEDYITDYKAWLKDRNEWLIAQWNIELTTGLDKTDDGDIIVSWDAVDGATGYSITYTPATSVEEAASLSLFNMSRIMTFAAGEETTIYIDDETATSYNFTDNGIALADNTTVTVGYTTDEVVDATATYETAVVDEAASELALLNRVTVDGLNATVVTNVTNSGTASAENVVLTLKDSTGTTVATQTIDVIPAGVTATATWERTEEAGSYTYSIETGLLTSGVTYTCVDKTDETLVWTEMDTTTYPTVLEGTKYVEVGSIEGQINSMSFGVNGYSFNTGAVDRGIIVRLNGKTLHENLASSALGMSVAYTTLIAGDINTLQIEYIDLGADAETLTTRVKTIYFDVPAEDAPDTSNVDTKAWVEIPIKGTNTDSVEYVYYINEEGYKAYVNTAIWGLFAPHTSTDYHANNAGNNCTITGNAIAFAHNTYNGNMSAVWVDDVKYYDDTELFNAANNALEMSTDLFPLADGQTETIHYVAVAAADGTHTAFAIKTEAIAPEAVTGLAYMGTDETPYVWTWTAVDGATSYEVTITDEEGNVVGETINTATTTVDATSVLGEAADGKYTVSVVAVDELGLKSEPTTITYKKGYAEPEYVDITLDKVEMTYAELATGQTATLKATLTNNGKSITNANGNIVMHFVTDTATGHSQGENGNILGQTWEVINFANLGLPQDENNNYVFGYGETITFTWTRTITDNFVTQGYVRVRATLEGGLANSDNNIADNYYTYEAIASIPNVTALTSVVNDDKTATLTWTAPEDENTYTYAIYDAEGTLVATTDATTYTTAVLDGTYTYTVKTVNADRESSGENTTVFVYTEPEADAWTQWDVGFGNTDVNGNSWYYYNGYNWNKVVTGAGAEWFGLKNDGHSYVTGTMAGEPVFEFPINGEDNSYNSVVVNGTEYTVAENPDVLFTVGNRVYLAQEIFALADDETEKIFAITANGNASNSFLIKVVKAITETTTVATEKPVAPTNLAWTGNADLPYYWSWQGSGADSYNVYVDDVLVINTKSALFNGAEYFADLGNATYTIKVTAVNSDGVESDPISTLYTKGFTYNNLTSATETVAQTFTFPISKEVGGETVYNYVAAGVTATASNSVGAYTPDLAVDGKVFADANYWRANESAEGEYITVDLGTQKPVKEIDLVWDNQNATTLDVLVSTDGVTYTKVADVINGTSTEERLDTLVLSEAVNAQYVRVLCKDNANGTIYNLREIAIYGTDVIEETTTSGDVETVLEAPEGLAVVDDIVTWQTVTDAVSYNVYINGELVGTTTAPSFDGTENFATVGQYTVEVAAVDAEGNEGEKASTTYVVEEKETTTEEDTEWIVVPASNDEFWYANTNNMTVNNVQQPGWASEQGIHMYTNEVPSYITINGVQVGTESVAIEGTGAVVYLSALTAEISTIEFCREDGTVIGSVDIKNVNGSTQEPTTEAPTIPQPDVEIDESAWVLIGNNMSNKNAKAYVQSSIVNTFGNAGLRGYYAAGTSANWNITDAFRAIDVFGFVTTGSNATSVIINGIEYTSDDKNVHTGGDCVYINQDLVNAEAGETKYYKITATGSGVGTEGTFVLKVVGEQAPDISGVTLPGEDGWTQITAGDAGGSADGSLYYIPTDTNIIGNDVRELENTGANVNWGGVENNPLTVPVLGVSIVAGNTGGNPVSVWIDGVKLDEDEVFVFNNVVSIAQEKFAVGIGEEKIFYVTFRSATGVDSTVPVKIVGPAPQDTWSDWVAMNDASGDNTVDYYYSTLSSNTLVVHADTRELPNTIIAVFNEGLTYAQLDGVDVAYNGAGVEINKANLVKGQEYVLVVGNATKTASVKFKYDPAPNYKPTGIAVTTDRGETDEATDDSATVTWMASEDAIAAGCTYTVTFNGVTTEASATTSATFDLSEVEYGTYPVVITTYDTEGNVLDTQTVDYRYSDPYAVESTVNFNNTLWEKFRYQTVTWTSVDAAKEYAIYADGVLVGTTTNLTYNVDAYNYANGTNANGQPTTVGNHTTTVVAVFDGETAPESLTEVNAARVMGTNDFSLNVNYIYGHGTDVWNKTGVDSEWNFTVSEAVAGQISEGASVAVEYDASGAANLTIVDNGTHDGNDQEWTIKAAIYDGKVVNGEPINLSFDILAPAELVGQSIVIKCCSEEVDANGIYTGPDAIYKEAAYTFEAVTDEEGNVTGAVIHYSETFTSKNDTYDLLFGLGELEPTTLTLTDASATKLYGVTSVTASGIVNTEDTTDNSMYVSWETNVPNILRNYYTYTLVVKDAEGNVVIEDNNATPGKIYKGVDPKLVDGTYTVEVSSVYNNTVTATKTTTATIDIEAALQPDLVISDISIVDTTKEYRVGDTVQFDITMTNIGTADATITDNEIVLMMYVVKEGSNVVSNYQFTPKVDGTATVEKEGGSVTMRYNYVISEEHHTGDYLFTIKALADERHIITESNEDNNEYSKIFMFNPALKVVTFANDGEDISASWPASTDSTVTSYLVEYTDSEGNKLVASSSTPELVLPDGTYFMNDSYVGVTAVCNDGTQYLYAEGRARADLIIESLEPVGGVAYVGEEIKFVSVVKNIGVAPATKKTNNAGDQMITVYFTTPGIDGLTGKYGMDVGYNTDGSPIYTTLLPNESSTINITDTTYKPAEVGTESFDAVADDINRILELNDTDGSGVDNNRYTVDVVVLNPSQVGLDLNEPEGEDSYVSATWTDTNILETSDPKLTVEGYKVTYTNAAGETKTVEVSKEFNTYVFTEELKNNTDVVISALYTEFSEKGYINIAKTKALADLDIVDGSIVITQDGEVVDTPATEREYQISFTYKNIGTASLPAALVPEDNPFLEYGKWILGNLQCAPSEGFECVATPANYNTNGIVAGETDVITFESVTFNKEGDFTLTANIDYPGHVEAAEGGYITESNEDNNSETKDITVKFIQNTEMDWTRLTMPDGTTNPYLFPVASGSQNAYIDYKILTTTETNYHYEDIINKFVGYNGANMSIGYAPDKTNVYFPGDDGSQHSYTKFEFAQVPNWNEFETEVVYNEETGTYVTQVKRDENGDPIEITPEADSKELVWITLPDKASTIHDVKGTEGNLTETIIPTDVADSPMGYNGNGYNFYVGNFGLYKCYLMKFTTPVPALDEFGNYTYDANGKMLFEYDEDGNLLYDELVVAYRVTDDTIRTNNWMQSLASDGVSNPNTLPIPYCGGDSYVDDDAIENTNKDIIYAEDDPDVEGNQKHTMVESANADKSIVIDDTSVTDNEHEDTEASQNYETIGAIWYDASDILLSSVSIYNGNWLSIATSEYLEISKGDQDNNGTKNMRLGIARAEVDPAQNNKFVGYATDFVVTDPNKSNTHLGIQGTNTIHVGLPWLLEELPTHSDLGGQKDQEYYWIRVYADINNVQETIIEEDGSYTQLANYIDIPITVYYDVPQIQPAQNVTATTSYDDNDDEIFSLSWGELAEMGAYGYKYKVFYEAVDGEGNVSYEDISLRLAQTTGLDTTGYTTDAEYYYDSPQVLQSNAQLYSDIVETDEEGKVLSGTLRVMAYWCEQSTPVDVVVQSPHEEGWYTFDGEGEINILAGQSMPIEMNGYMSYYYQRTNNHSSGTIGYNGYFVSINGNSRYFASNSKVSIATGTTVDGTLNKFVSRSDMKDEYYDKLYAKVNEIEAKNREDAGDDSTIDTSLLDKNVIDELEAGLNLKFKEIENPSEDGYVAGQLQIESKTLFQATNFVTWYLVKVETPVLDAEGNETGDIRVAYVMMESYVKVGGDIAIQGFQMNTDTTYGGVSEYSPSFRVVSRATKLTSDPTGQETFKENGVNIDLGEDNPVYTALDSNNNAITNELIAAVVGQGTIYGYEDSMTEGAELEVTVEKDENGNVVVDEYGNPVVNTNTEAGVYQIPTTAGGILTDWSGSVNHADKDAYTYYAVTFKPINYTVTGLLWNYKIKAYAVTENGTVIYEEATESNDPVKEASVYKIAETLYQNSSMTTIEDHEFLYDNVLNIVNMYRNYDKTSASYQAISKFMLKALNVRSTASLDYKYVNTAYQDMYSYIHIARNYEVDSYSKRGKFVSKTEIDGVMNETLLLERLNTVKTKSETDYTSVADWIYSEMGTEEEGYQNKGFYKKVEWVAPNNGTVESDQV